LYQAKTASLEAVFMDSLVVYPVNQVLKATAANKSAPSPKADFDFKWQEKNKYRSW